jgi:hypothetical protein
LWLGQSDPMSSLNTSFIVWASGLDSFSTRDTCPAVSHTQPINSVKPALNIPNYSFDASYEPDMDPTTRGPGTVERQLKASSDDLSDEELYARHVEAEKAVITKYDLIPVPGFFHMPRTGEEGHEMHQWADKNGVSGCVLFRSRRMETGWCISG